VFEHGYYSKIVTGL
jgi:hypothetical protein